MSIAFDAFSNEYDEWFKKNEAVLESEVRLVARALGDNPGETLSVGCGTGLFEQLLASQFGISVGSGIEPSEPMAEVARKRGMTVTLGGGEEIPCDDEQFDTVMFNGSPSYIEDLDKAVREALRILKPGGRLILIDVPAESSYGLLYRLGGEIGTWDDERLSGVLPPAPYPVELAGGAIWRTTQMRIDILERAGLQAIESWQTLTRHPKYSNDSPEDPRAGHEAGDYVAVIGTKPPHNTGSA